MTKELSLLDAYKAYNAGKPVNVTARYLFQSDTKTGHAETGTETAGERHPDRAGDRQRVFHSFHIAGDRDPATMYGSEPSQVSKPPTRP